MRYLLLTLYAPLGACGEIAVGERRMSWARPGRSAILGLVAAACGVERADEAAHRRLDADPATLLPAIARGFGAAKAYGCGLLLIRRLRSANRAQVGVRSISCAESLVRA